MGRKSVLQETFDKLQTSVDANVSCELTPRQCKELLSRELYYKQYADQLVKRMRELIAEIRKLNQLLADADNDADALAAELALEQNQDFLCDALRAHNYRKAIEDGSYA